MTPKKTLKKWFSNFMKPAQEHFYAWIDSFWHKSEPIPMSSIDGLSRAIENTVSAKQLLNHINDTNAHRALFDELKRQIQAIQTILQVDDVNLDTLQEIVTELKANTKLQELIDKKVNKEEGKGLSSNDFTNELKQKLEGLQPTDVSGLLPKGGYDGTGQQLKEAIDGLQTKMQQVETTLSVDDTDFDTLQEIATQVKSNKNLETLLTSKVNKEDGKGLSTNDFTNELKAKLEGLSPLAGSFLSNNLIRGNVGFSRFGGYGGTIKTYSFPVDDGINPNEKILFSYVGYELNSSNMKVALVSDIDRKEVTGTLFYKDNNNRIHYLIEAKGFTYYSATSIKLEVTSDNFGYPQLRRFLDFPKADFDNSQALLLKNNDYAVNGVLNNIKVGENENAVVTLYYRENSTFSFIKTGSDDGKVKFDINGSAEFVGNNVITGKAGSTAICLCFEDKVYITIHNRE